MRTTQEQKLYEFFDAAFAPVTADTEKLKRRIMEKWSYGKSRKTHKRFLPLRIILASVLVLALSVTTYAVAIGGFEELLSRVSPSYADYVEPVSIVTEDEGIRLEVIAAQRYNDEALLYVTVEDLTGEGRVDETTRIDTDYEGLTSFMPISIRELEFNEETGKAAFEVRVRTEETTGDLTVCFNKVMTLIKTLNEENVQIDIEKYLQESGDRQMKDAQKESGSYPEGLLNGSHIVNVPGTDDAYISAVGISDGWFCVQTTEPRNVGYITEVRLRDANGNMVMADMSVNSGPKDIRIQEYYFDIDVTRLSAYNIYVEGIQRNILEGDWAVQIDLGNTAEPIMATGWVEAIEWLMLDGVHEGEMAFGEITVVLNPLGMTVTGYGNLFFAIQNAEIYTTQGMIPLARQVSSQSLPDDHLLEDKSNWEELAFEAYFSSEIPIDLNTVTEIWMDGNRIWKKDT